METDPPPATDRLEHPWTDVSSFSHGDKDRTPKTWKANFGRFALCVTRHCAYAPDVWVAFCPGVINDRAMESKNLVEAADQAMGMLQSLLETSVAALSAAGKTSSFDRLAALAQKVADESDDPPCNCEYQHENCAAMDYRNAVAALQNFLEDDQQARAL